MHTDRKAPRGMMALAAVLSLTGFIFFLLVTLSAPIISSIGFTRMTSDDSATTLDTGVFGVCYRVGMGTSFSALRFGIGNPQNPDPNVTQRCTRIGLGWLARISPRPEIDFYEIAPPSFARALVLNVIAAAFAAAAMLSAAIGVCSPGRVMGVITVGFLSLATLFAWPAFGVDIAFSRRTRDHLEGIWDSWHVQLGNANWLALGGVIALTLALVFAIVTLLQPRRPPAREPRFAEPNMRKTSTVNSSFETGRA